MTPSPYDNGWRRGRSLTDEDEQQLRRVLLAVPDAPVHHEPDVTLADTRRTANARSMAEWAATLVTT